MKLIGNRLPKRKFQRGDLVKSTSTIFSPPREAVVLGYVTAHTTDEQHMLIEYLKVLDLPFLQNVVMISAEYCWTKA